MKNIYFLCFIFILILFGCGGKEKVKPSEDSILTMNTLRAIETIKDAYQKKDMSSLQQNFDATLYDKVSKELVFSKAELSFSTPRMVRIGKSDIKVLQNWHGEWTIQERKVSNRGVSTLVFDRETLKLLKVNGANPFILPLIK